MSYCPPTSSTPSNLPLPHNQNMGNLPNPFAYAQKDAFFALPQEDRPPHIWECLQYLEWRRGHGDVTADAIDRQVDIMRHIAQDVAKHIARELERDGSWKDRFNPRWPRYHPNSKDPLYLTGCHPPLILCIPEDDEAWKANGFPEGQREFAEWLLTPAGMHRGGLTEEQRAQAFADAKTMERLEEADRKAQAALKRLSSGR